jgi:hypothetical protein
VVTVPPIDDDYTPIIRQGTIEKISGILGRRRIRQSLPDAGHGEELVLLDSRGGPVGTGGHITAGERYWGSLRGWVMVDASDHHLSFSFACQDIDGAAGYQIEAVTRVSVVDAAATVRRNVRGVRAYVEPALRSRATGCLSNVGQANGADTLTMLNTRLANHSASLSRLVGSHLQVADWLSTVITDLSIQFDAATTEHYDQLVAANRRAELSNTTLIHQQQTAMHEIKLRKTWSDHLTDLVSDPVKVLVEAVAADPSPANIKELGDKLSESDDRRYTEFLTMLNRMIDREVIVEVDDLPKARVLYDGLRKSLSADDGQQRSVRMIDDAQSQPEKTIADAEIVEDRDQRSQYDPDRDWNN